MTNRIPFYPDRYYHLCNRGVDKRSIFNDDQDRHRFLATLLAANGDEPFNLRDWSDKTFEEISELRGAHLVDLCAYCLMPNHFHLLIRERNPAGASKFLQKLGISFTGYFNRRNDRSGVLFQGQTQSVAIKDEAHLRTAIQYINENPAKMLSGGTPIEEIQNLDELLASYEFSSYRDYARPENLRPERLVLSLDVLPLGFGQIIRESPEIGSREGVRVD